MTEPCAECAEDTRKAVAVGVVAGALLGAGVIYLWLRSRE
jgi:hypothetical protein